MSLSLLHGSHPYFAKFHYELPLRFIEQHTQSGDVVLDPFSGSGTTLIAANSAGRNAVGVDANPLACLIAKVKTSRATDEDLTLLDDLARRSMLFGDQRAGKIGMFQPEAVAPADLPSVHNFQYWFDPHVAEELQAIKGLVGSTTAGIVHDAARLAFSRIIVRASNQQGESVYRRVHKRHADGACWYMFADALFALVDTLRRSRGTLAAGVESSIHNKDCRTFALSRASADLVVTSPPYLNSWDYSLYQKFRMAWLDFDSKSYADVEVGNHLRTLRDGDREIVRYKADMTAVFSNLSVALRPGGYCIFVNGECVVSGEIINTDAIIVEAAAGSHLKLVDSETLPILGPHYGNHDSMKTRKVTSKIIRNKTESVLRFVRTLE